MGLPGLVAKAKGDEAIRWRRRADAAANSGVIESLVAQEADRRVAIWLRVRLGGKRMTTVAADYGYRDGSGIHRVVQQLKEKAKDDQALPRRLKALAKHLSNVRKPGGIAIISAQAGRLRRVISGCGPQRYGLELCMSDLVPLECVEHHDGEANLQAGQSQSLPLGIPHALVIHEIVHDPFGNCSVSPHQVSRLVWVGFHPSSILTPIPRQSSCADARSYQGGQMRRFGRWKKTAGVKLLPEWYCPVTVWSSPFEW